MSIGGTEQAKEMHELGPCETGVKKQHYFRTCIDQFL